MTEINDALGREIIHASVSGGPAALSHYHAPSHASALRALVVAQRRQSRPGLGSARRAATAIRAAFAAPAQPACCPGV